MAMRFDTVGPKKEANCSVMMENERLTTMSLHSLPAKSERGIESAQVRNGSRGQSHKGDHGDLDGRE